MDNKGNGTDALYDGWFGGLGETGVLLQNILTILFTIVFAIAAAYMFFLMIKRGAEIAQAPDANSRKTAKEGLLWTVVGALVIVGGGAVILALMNTVGDTTKISTEPNGNILSYLNIYRKGVYVI